MFAIVIQTASNMASENKVQAMKTNQAVKVINGFDVSIDYDFKKFTDDDIKQVISDNGYTFNKTWSRPRLIDEANYLIQTHRIDEIEFIIYESGI